MDIYILREGIETGPFSEETTQRLLKQGSILVNDLAWRPGMADWLPLVQVLYPAATPGTGPSRMTEGEGISGQPATDKQKAFLSYLGIPFSPDLSREQGSFLVAEAMESSELHARVTLWNEDRLKMHPELFAAEIQARKETRAARFFARCEMEGAEHFTGVTKAHCQVLVGYLDVRFPNWDAREAEATWSYFFPAIAEKFPDLVNKPWRGKLKYPEGPKVAPELVRRPPVARPRSRVPFSAMVRGGVFGLGILLALYIAQELFRGGGMNPAGSETPAQVSSAAPTPAESPLTDPSKPSPGSEQSAAPQTGVVVSNSSLPAPAPVVTPTPVAMANSGEEPPPSSVPLFNSAASVGEPTSVPATKEATPVPPRTTVVLMKPYEVRLPFGTAKLPAGKTLKFVSQDGAVVKAIYENSAVILPISVTDLAADAAVP